jgi:hypothetical protein
MAGFAASTSAVPEPDVIDRAIQIADAGYIGSAAEACHPSEYATWHRSYHRSMTQVATRESVIADFENTTVTEVPGRPMSLERRGDGFWATLDDPDWDVRAGPKPRIERRIVMTTGSTISKSIGHYATGRGRLPASCRGVSHRRTPVGAAIDGANASAKFLFSETGSWNSTCIACHTTQGKPMLAAAAEHRRTSCALATHKAPSSASPAVMSWAGCRASASIATVAPLRPAPVERARLVCSSP